MKHKTELAVVALYRKLITQHLSKRRPKRRLNAKQVMDKVRARYDVARSTVYEYINTHDKTLLN